RPHDEDAASAPVVPLPIASAPPPGPFAVPGVKNSDYTDGRPPGDWESKYPKPARSCINHEACVLAVHLLLMSLLSGVLLGLSSQSLQVPMTWVVRQPDAPVPVLNIDFRLLMIFSVGSLGGTTFSIKWLVHAAAKRSWHLDRRYWRLFVPLIGGVYACVVLALLDGGVIGAQTAGQPRPVPLTAAFAFLVGYFSDGVSGLLSNIANAVFGTLEKK
ncbi:MAG: hypothetical protein ACREDM_13360, partial [Methylocella sp.]